MKNKVIKRLLLIVSIIIISLFGVYVFRLMHPYKFIYTSSNVPEMKGYLRFYSKVMREEKFNDLLIKLTENNNDIRLLDLVANYANDENICYIIPYLENRVEYFKNFPQDTVWTVRLKKSYYRQSSKEMLEHKGNFTEELEKLKLKCENE